MTESLVQVAPDSSGKKLHTWSYTAGANTVEDEFTVPGPFPFPTYEVHAAGVSTATANDHLLCLNAGASLKLRVVRIRVEQVANATAVAAASIAIFRTTTGAPTGGTAVTANPLDTGDAAAGAAGRSLPAVKGTETTELMRTTLIWRQALSATQAQIDDAWEWTALSWEKAIMVPVGTTNGLVVKLLSAIAGASANVSMEFVELAY